MTQLAKAHTIKTTFSRETSITINITAEAATVWALLVDAANMPSWNSTVVSVEGAIEPQGKIALVSTLDESRTFNLSVKEFEPNKRLVWGDRQGNRVYTLTPHGNGVTFKMSEKIGGLLFPLFARFIPPFDTSFEQFAADLKATAERN